MTAAIDVTDLSFSYGDRRVVDLGRFELAKGASLAVIGPSGCGKTTLLHLLAGLIRPDTGRIHVLGQDLSELSDTALDRFRGRSIGLVFQRFHLLPALNVRENALLAMKLARSKPDREKVEELFHRLGLEGLERHKPSMLSQGQAQRVAIARALVHGPPIVMADEPTSALDDGNAAEVIELLRESVAAAGAALLVVTHDQRVRGLLDSEHELTVSA